MINMFKSKKAKALIPVLGFVLVAVIVIGIIAAVPYDTAAVDPAGGFQNIANGGLVAADGSMLYYVDGEGVLRCVSGAKSYRVAKGASCVSPYESGAVYLLESGDVCFSRYDGSDRRTLISGVKRMMLNGNWLFYTKADGVLCKLFMKTGESTSTGLKVGQFAVAATAVIYIADDGKLHTAYTDGSKDAVFYNETTDFFLKHGSLIFYKHNGLLCSVATGNTASKQTYFNVDRFTINDSNVLFFTDESGLHCYDLAADKPKVRDIEIHGSSVESLSVDGDYLYYNNGDGQLVRCLKDGSEWSYM